MGLVSSITKAYPKAMWPSRQQVFGYAAWGGVVGAVALYAVQPWDYLSSVLGTKKEDQ